MAKKNTKSRYWVDDNSILPEIVITPQGNYPVLDEAGNPARTVGAIQDINPNAHIYERVNTQPFMDDYIEGETNTAANQRADALDAQVVPHIGDFVSAATKPLDVLMPSRWVGLLDKDYNGLSVGDRLTRLFDEHNKGLYINDNPAGLFSKRFHDEHPIWAMAGNTAFDIASTPFIWNGANKAYNAGKTAYNTGRNAGIPSLNAEVSSKYKYDLNNVGALSNEDIFNNLMVQDFLAGKKQTSFDMNFPSSWTRRHTPFPEESVQIINNSIRPRILAQAEKDLRDMYDPAIDGPDIEAYIADELKWINDRLDKQLAAGHEVASDEVFQAYDKYANHGDFKTAGLQMMDKDGTIYLREGEDGTWVLPHEWRHRTTNNLTGGEYYGNEKRLLRKAYTKEFDELAEIDEDLKGTDMNAERVTTNGDARTALIGRLHAKKTPVHLQNKIIDKKTDEEVFKAVEKANGYGRKYIAHMRKLGKLTPELAQALREAMKNVGMYAVPATVAGTAYGASQQDNNVKAYGGLLYNINLFGGGGTVHSVQKGDTLWGISQQYNIPLAKLRQLNPKIKGDIIIPGQQLQVSPQYSTQSVDFGFVEPRQVEVFNNQQSYGGLLEMANKFKDGGSKNDYNTWKKKIKNYKGIIVDGDDTYDYYNFFKDNPQMAWDMLNDNPEAHFTDKYKTPNHPTYSNESIYSRAPYIQGGSWNDYSPTVMGQKWNYALSPSQVNSNWDVERTINYLADAENEGAYVTDNNGRYPIVDGTVLGGTLAPVTITPNNHSQGGHLKPASWNDLSMREKADIIKVGVKHGLNRLADIKSKYNEFASGGDTTSELDWSPQSWFELRTPKPDGTLYSDQEAAILASHVPEYLQIEKTAKANGTWLKMPDGSTWQGDPRSWVMMQSEAYKKNYSPKPWYTGQAEWPTTFDYGNGAVETNKVTRAPYYNGQMWFSDNKSYGDTFANYIDKSGDNLLINPDYPDFKDPNRPIGRNFLSAVPQKGNYRNLTSPDDGTHDYWTGLPYDLKDNSIYRLDNSKIVIGEDKDGLPNTNIRADGNKVLTDDVVDWSKNLGDNGIYIHQVNDGPVVNTEDGSIYSPVINEFISQPGFTDKVKFIEGNTGDFDISNPYKYAYNMDKRNTPVTGNYAALGGNIYSGTKTASQQMNQQVKQKYIYDILPQLYAMDGVNVRVSSGLRPNAVVYQNGVPTNRKSRHGMGQAVDIVPGEGATFNDIFRVLNNPNSNVSKWMRANGAGFIDETSATGTTKYWHDHKKDHSHVHHQIGGSPARQYATRFNVQQRPVNKAWERRAEAYWEKAQAMYQELLDAGVNPVAAAGILGNVAVESEFNPNAANSINGGHWGYLQNDKNITPWVRANYGGYDHRSQMNYLIAGLQGRLPKSNMGLDRRFNGFNARMQGVTDPEMAAYLWEREYEKSANEGVPQRKYFARYFYDRMMGNNGMVQQQYNPLMFSMEDPSQYNINAGMPENVDPELYYRELDRKKWEDDSYSSLLSNDANQDSTAVDRAQVTPESQASSFLKWIVPMLSSQSSSNTGDVLLNTINMLNYGTKSPDIYSSFNPFSLTV